MLLLTSTQTASLQHWFLPERSGALVGPHVLETGNGACWVDRWPAPQAVLVKISVNHTLVGDVHAVTSSDLQPHINGYVETSETFLPLLRATFADVHLTPRIVLVQTGAAREVQSLDYPLRRLVAADTSHLESLDPKLAWICKSWGGPYGLASSGCSWGIFVDDQLAAVACTFFLGKTYEDIGIRDSSPVSGPWAEHGMRQCVVQRYSRARPSTKLGYDPGQPGQPARRGETRVHSTAQ